MLGELELVIDAKATLGEGPCWDSQKQLLYWIDILEKKVHIYNPVTNEDKEIFLGQMVGSVVPGECGEMILALENGFYFLNPDTEELRAICDPESHLQENRFNVTSCTFGVRDLNELYITTAKMHTTDASAGGVFRIKTNVRGCPTYQFNGEIY